MAASANTGQGMVAVVVRKRVVHIVDSDATDTRTVGEDLEISTETSTVPKPHPLFKIPPAQQATSTTVPQAIQTSTNGSVTPSDSVWPEYACLVLGSNGSIGIRLQTPELAVIIRSAIHKIISWMLFKDSFPSLLTRALWNRTALAEASKEFMDCARGPLKERYEVIHHRIFLDPTFVNRIGRLVYYSTIWTMSYY